LIQQLGPVVYEQEPNYCRRPKQSSYDCRAAEARQATIKLVAVDGAEFTFLSPNAETVARIITVFLEGLRRRSRWAIAIQSYDSQGKCMISVWLAQLVKALAAPTVTCSLMCAGGPGSIPGADKLDSGFHPFGVGEMSSS